MTPAAAQMVLLTALRITSAHFRAIPLRPANDNTPEGA